MKVLPPRAEPRRLNGAGNLFLISILFIFLLAGCRKEIETNPPPLPDVESLAAGKEAPPAIHPKLKEYRIVTGTSDLERGKAPSTKLLKFDPQYRQMVLQALKVADAPCNDNTKLNQWLDNQLADWDLDVVINALNTGMLDLPTYHALIFENRTFGQYFGKRGEYTFRLLLSFQKLKHFWDIDSKSIVLAGLHGKMLQSRYKVYNTYRTVYELTPEDALYYTNVVSKLLQTTPQYRKGEHPIFTFNAFSQSSFYFPSIGVIPPKIVMGDGILDGFAAIGYADVAPQAILAHEYGHQVQFQLGLYGAENTAESTRRLELMADAFSAYYLTHIRGEFMRWGRMRQFLQVFFNIGDCQTSSPSHHGTPNQRMAAAEWAYGVAKNAERQGKVLSGKAFQQMFDAALPQILAH